MKDLILPVGLIAVIGCMILPLPTFAVDCLLVVNLVTSVLLVGCALYISNPIKLSSLPTILLLSTLYRLALNISTTRRILGEGDAGEMIELFGSLLIQGDLFVGLVVFLVITLVQFIVIAKGSERVAEVSARFTLDALPGKQMSIDADVRSGQMDMETARRKREDLQTESRFYGALDGAMKFVKGDAIAGIVITAVNILGGLAVGILVKDMAFAIAVQKYTLLTLGDGLLSQIPALLNSLAAGLIVTRVAKDNADSLATEVLDQVGAIKPALILSGVVSILLAFVGVAILPFLALGGLFLFLGFFVPVQGKSQAQEVDESFKPKIPSLITIELPKESIIRSCKPKEIQRQLAKVLTSLYEEEGLLLTPPDLTLSESMEGDYRFLFRGIRNPGGANNGVKKFGGDYTDEPDRALQEVCEGFQKFVLSHKTECIDDIFTRRVLDHLEQFAPELVTNCIPSALTVTGLTSILRELVRDDISIRNIDVIVQAVAEIPGASSNERILFEQVRIALKRVISRHYAGGGVLHGVRIDPALDIWLSNCERDKAYMNPEILYQVEQDIREHLRCFQSAEKQEELREGEKGPRPLVVLTSRSARRLLQECLRMRGVPVVVLAEEELCSDLHWVEEGYLRLPDESASEIFGRLAA